MPGITGQQLVQSFTGSLPEVVQSTRDFVLRGDVVEGLSPALVFAIRLALEEAVTNAHRHGHRGDPDLPISIEFSRIGDDLILEVADTGEGFDPGSIPDPRSPEGLERSSGRGLLLIRAFMHHVEHLDAGRRIRMHRCLASAGSS